VNVLACGATTNSATTEWRVPLDSARQVSLGSTSHKFSDCSGCMSKGGEVCLGGFLCSGRIGNIFAL
jgi:hypothetical protein